MNRFKMNKFVLDNLPVIRFYGGSLIITLVGKDFLRIGDLVAKDGLLFVYVGRNYIGSCLFKSIEVEAKK